MTPLLTTVLVISLLYGLWKIVTFGRRERGLPPGPATAPFFGNALQMPSSFLHVKLSEWARQFGEFYSIKILNNTIVVISGAKAVREILEKQGASSGGRPPSNIMDALSERKYLALMDMDDTRWKKERALIHALVSEEGLEKYHSVHEAGSITLLKDMLDSPRNICEHLKKMMVSNWQHQVFGKPCSSYKNDTPEVFFHGVKMFSECLDIAARLPFDSMSFVKYIPDRWVSWRAKCKSVVRMRRALWEKLVSEGEQAVQLGNVKGCYLETLLQRCEGPDTLSHDEMLYFTGAILDAAAETTAASLENLLLALVNFPGCQEKARKELDAFIPADRLPVFDDFKNLTYLQAFILEVRRFRPLFPTGPLHYATRDIWYNGYHIPEGTTLTLNIWHLLHDAEIYDEPETFNPERFVLSKFGTKAGVDTADFRNNYVFGAGRRLCPGENMASRTIAVTAMRWLWGFEFSKDDSGTGNITFDAYGDGVGIELAPLPFTCNVVPRKKRDEFIRRLYSQVVE